MKKITKRIMALMLSLVMIIGCIPGLTNEVSAADLTIAELLPANFPTDSDSAWKADNGNYVYLNGNNLSFISSSMFDYGDANSLTINDQGNYILKQTPSDLVFVMEDNKLVEIISYNDECPGTYKPEPVVTEGFITASPLTAGTKVNDINYTFNFGKNDLSNIEHCDVFESNVKMDADYALEAGKTYRIDTVMAIPDAANYETIYFNNDIILHKGDFQTLENGIIARFTIICQAPKSSKKYKASNTNNAAGKISGSGKKGSKRTITPIEGKKVASVIVKDKDGNKIDVILNEDGTYSFIQPASNVDVEVIYKNREITLTIGSTVASCDGENSNLDVAPIIRNDRTMLPIRFIAENLGAKVEWNEKNPNTVIITRGDIKIEITLGSDIMLVNGNEVRLDSVAFAENDRTYLPVRAISEALNAIVEWNENEPSTIKIYER